MQTDAAVNAGGEVNPIPICSFYVFARSLVDARDRTGVDTIGNAFANIRHYSVGHRLLLTQPIESIDPKVSKQPLLG